MRIREVACRNCAALGAGLADPVCPVCQGLGSYADYSRTGIGKPLIVPRRSNRGRKSRMAVVAFLAAVGFVLIAMGYSATETTIIAFGGGLLAIALALLSGRALVTGLVEFSNSRIGHLVIWASLVLIAGLTILPAIRG